MSTIRAEPLERLEPRWFSGERRLPREPCARPRPPKQARLHPVPGRHRCPLRLSLVSRRPSTADSLGSPQRSRQPAHQLRYPKHGLWFRLTHQRHYAANSHEGRARRSRRPRPTRMSAFCATAEASASSLATDTTPRQRPRPTNYSPSHTCLNAGAPPSDGVTVLSGSGLVAANEGIAGQRHGWPVNRTGSPTARRKCRCSTPPSRQGDCAARSPLPTAICGALYRRWSGSSQLQLPARGADRTHRTRRICHPLPLGPARLGHACSKWGACQDDADRRRLGRDRDPAGPRRRFPAADRQGARAG